MRYLVTGGAGFIGTHLIQNLLSDSATDSVVVLDLKPPAFEHPKLCHFIHDLRVSGVPASIGRCDVCIHLAALCKEPGYHWDEYFETNYSATRRLCEALSALEVTNVIFTSTMMVFRAQERRMAEDSLTAPDTAYGMSKLLAEKELENWAAREGGRRLRIVRLGVVFGKGENGNFTRLYRALKRRSFAYIGKSTTVKGCVYVKDVVRCVRFLIGDSGTRTIYNFVIPESTTVAEICRAMQLSTHLGCFGIPTIPYRLAVGLGYLGEFASQIGFRTGLHHRRIQKLYYSTHLSSDALWKAGFSPDYNLASALADWRADCAPDDLF